MSWTRRRFLIGAGGGLAALGLSGSPVAAEPAVIAMRGTARGERVWFEPLGLAVAIGTAVRFVNRDAVNSHTATAYHPETKRRHRRIPAAAAPWHSGFLLPGEDFRVRLEHPGVYDYYCIPHERAGMVGRIVVATPDAADWEGAADAAGRLPEAAASVLPPAQAILSQGRIMSAEGRV